MGLRHVQVRQIDHHGGKGAKPAQRPEKARAKMIFMSLVLKLHAQSCV
jgi:hypothetical protein